MIIIKLNGKVNRVNEFSIILENVKRKFQTEKDGQHLETTEYRTIGGKS